MNRSEQAIVQELYPGCKFSDFSLISDFLTWTHLNFFFESPYSEHISLDFIIDSDFQQKVYALFHTFLLNVDYNPVYLMFSSLQCTGLGLCQGSPILDKTTGDKK